MKKVDYFRLFIPERSVAKPTNPTRARRASKPGVDVDVGVARAGIAVAFVWPGVAARFDGTGVGLASVLFCPITGTGVTVPAVGVTLVDGITVGGGVRTGVGARVG
jgi:hypothetical protein